MKVTRPENARLGCLLALFVVMAFSTSGARADRIEGHGIWQWSASYDNGVTWGTGVVNVPLGTASVWVRLTLSWSGIDAPTQYFGGVYTDLTVTSVNNAGMGDMITNVRGPDIPYNAQWISLRFADVLKLDSGSDLLPPGQDPFHWLPVNQLAPGVIGFRSLANPISPIEYLLTLDGSVGDRLVDAVFRPVTVNGVAFARHLFVYDDRLPASGGEIVITETLDYQPLVLHVVPAPCSGFGVFAAMGVSCLVRRRR